MIMKSIKMYFWTVLFLCFFSATGCSQQTQNNKDYNHLKSASSPYLKEHADNPVWWHEWNPEALALAKKEKKPLLISIGYSACYWCHVMERQSYMDTAVANYMNAHFICIKVDREERPDIDQIYMNAAQLLTGQGGWPLNAFALPNGKPFYAGTYYPKKEWLKLLHQVVGIYKNDHQKVEHQAESLTEGIRQQNLIKMPEDSVVEVQKKDYESLFNQWKANIDYKKGGFNHTPKFPLPNAWNFLLQYHYLTGNKKALDAVNITLQNMAKGGIYDQIGGGFARYSTDDKWFAPHFEKMLYDNGQLISLYAKDYKITKNPKYAAVIQETLSFIQRELSSPAGGFYASINAESEGVEGKYYVWSKKAILAVLSPKVSDLITEYYGITSAGNWEQGKNILYQKYNDKAFAKKHQMSIDQWMKIKTKANQRLLNVRNKRIHPSTDDKILTSWNALMMKGYIDAYLALGDKMYLQAAIKNAGFLEKKMIKPDGSIWRNYKDGKASIPGFLDDYAFLSDAYIHLYQATFDIHWLHLAKKIAHYAYTHFQDKKSGLFYYTSNESTPLIARKIQVEDNVMPGSNSVMATVLYQLGTYFYNTSYTKKAIEMVNTVKSDIVKGSPFYSNWAFLMGAMTYGNYEVAIMGKAADKENVTLQKRYLPTSLFMGGASENLPLLENKLVKGKTRIYVCKNKVCNLPANTIEEALQQLKIKK